MASDEGMRDQYYQAEESFLTGPKSGHDVLLFVLCHVNFPRTPTDRWIYPSL